jgi:hypothetical protein
VEVYFVYIQSQSNDDDWYDSLLSFNATGNLITKVGSLIIEGPILTLNVWTHIVQIFAVNDGSHLIVNETTYSTSGLINLFIFLLEMDSLLVMDMHRNRLLMDLISVVLMN